MISHTRYKDTIKWAEKQIKRQILFDFPEHEYLKFPELNNSKSKTSFYLELYSLIRNFVDWNKKK